MFFHRVRSFALAAGFGCGCFLLLGATNAFAQLTDADNDGLADVVETNTGVFVSASNTGTDPNNSDTDNDGMKDGWDVQNNFNPLSAADAALDTDSDGLTNLREFQVGTNPRNSDTDGDGLSDSAEVNTYLTDPRNTDTDGDKMTDYQELFVFFSSLGTDPLDPTDRPPTKPLFTPVGDPRNPDDESAERDAQNAGVGYVGQPFEISITEVTNEMYALFLNSVAKRDRIHGLYKPEMGINLENGGILRQGKGEPGDPYIYTVKAGFETKPVNFVSLWDVLRYINWLHNWKKRDFDMRDAFRPELTVAQDQTPDTTEDGAYTLRGKNPEFFVRNAGAHFFLPDRDEWHKAAYFDPEGDIPNNIPSNIYWDHAAQRMDTNNLPAFTLPLAPVGANLKNFPTNGTPLVTRAYFSPSHYGTFDQDGNVQEWVQEAIVVGGREANFEPETESESTGFRVAKPLGELGVPIPPEDVLPPLVSITNGSITNAPNPPDIQAGNGLGSVGVDFKIGVFEVTNEEYIKFLNAVATSDDPYGLYDVRMFMLADGGIERKWNSVTRLFVYSVKEGPANLGLQPVNYVSLFSAMRYCNWLHNGGNANADTEAGAYRLLGSLPPNTTSVQRNSGARYFLPTESEWYKAAFYDPRYNSGAPDDAVQKTFGYWSFATKSDTADPQKIVFNGTAATGLATIFPMRPPSPFGTRDQSGNIAEWTESLGLNDSGNVNFADGVALRVVRGGSWQDSQLKVSAEDGFSLVKGDTKSGRIGFRIAAAIGAASGASQEDSDGDGLSDGVENDSGVYNGPANPGTDPKDDDSDDDGLGDGAEVYFYKSNPLLKDTDGDGIQDGDEVKKNGTDPSLPDTDGDGLSDGVENKTGIYESPSKTGTDPKKQDTDGDGLRDGVETNNGVHNGAADTGTDPNKPDTDGDGLSDGVETNTPVYESPNTGTDPNKRDTDGDGMDDKWEIEYALDPLLDSDGVIDSDGDGLSNAEEFANGTRPRLKPGEDPTLVLPHDSDFTLVADKDGNQKAVGDGLLDGEEVKVHKTNPLLQDSDEDGLDDKHEVQISKTNPNSGDIDKDGIQDPIEIKLKTDPFVKNDDPAPFFVTVGNPGNPDEDAPDKDLQNGGLGYVGQIYGIMSTEVTNLMYAKFLNAVATKQDRYGLYSDFMGTVGGIVKSGNLSAGYSYAVKAGYESRPVNFVSAFDALRYINWLHNGMPVSGDQDASSTEDGAYRLLGKNSGDITRREPGAQFFLPDRDEWHKAAYYDPNPGLGRPDESYWPYARDNSPAGPSGNYGADRTLRVASYEFSGPSHYGTYDQDGNVLEWTESGITGTSGLQVMAGRGTTSDQAATGLVLFIDTARKLLWLEGSATGAFGPDNLARWVYPVSAVPDAAATSIFGNPTDPTATLVIGNDAVPIRGALIGSRASGVFNFGLVLPENEPRSGELRGAGVSAPQDYSKDAGGALVAPSVLENFESAIGREVFISGSAVFGNRRLQVAGASFGASAGIPQVSGATSENFATGFRVAARRAQPDVESKQIYTPLMVEVGNPRNPADDQAAPLFSSPPLGAVNYTFQMGAYEVTNLEYVRFLNARAKDDTILRLFDTRMETEANGGIIRRPAEGGGHTYEVKPGFAKKPVVYVSIYSAMRYCNWLHNGGGPDSDTETGAYRLLGNIPEDTPTLSRNYAARYYLPNADEFYKAAYYDKATNEPEKSRANATFNYWKFATRNDNFDTNHNSSTLTNVDFSSVASYFGTYGQSGNVGYISPSPTNSFASKPTPGETGELIEEANNSEDERPDRTFRVAAAATVQPLSPLADRDADGLLNGWEVLHGLDPFDNGVDNLKTAAPNDGKPSNGASGNPDDDGLNNLLELGAKTDPGNPDSDYDGMKDGWEVTNGFKPLDDTDAALDADNDGLINRREFELLTNPKNADTDGGKASDGWEVQYNFDPKNAADDSFNPDDDGLVNWRESEAGTDPRQPDTDGDGLKDGAEVDIHRTNPKNADTDNDGIRDADEIGKTNPLVFDAPPGAPEFVAVASPGNTGNPLNSGKGGVAYQFRIGKYEVTNLDYAAFLNDVAKVSDPHGLYDVRMGFNFQLDPADPRNINVTGGITRSVSGGLMSYTVKRGFERKPVNFVSYDSALRYCNWLHNGAGFGASTETGAYTMAGGKARAANARFWLPNYDEWYKAAAFDPAAGNRYWLFAYRSDTADPRRLAISPAGFADVNKPGASSYFGTMGQSGNAGEWVEVAPAGKPTVAGGSILSYAYQDSGGNAATTSLFEPSTLAGGRYDLGFRIATLPAGTKPQTISLSSLPTRRTAGSPALKITALASSRLPVTFESSDPEVAEISDGPLFDYLIVKKPGKAVITARQTGDSVWAPAKPVIRTVTVTAPVVRSR